MYCYLLLFTTYHYSTRTYQKALRPEEDSIEKENTRTSRASMTAVDRTSNSLWKGRLVTFYFSTYLQGVQIIVYSGGTTQGTGHSVH